MALIEFENQDKYFIKFFLLDATLNLNSWGVTQQSLEKNLQSFIGNPFVLTPEFNHPNAIDGDDLLVQQEAYRVGNIIMVGIENRTGKAYGVAEIFDERRLTSRFMLLKSQNFFRNQFSGNLPSWEFHSFEVIDNTEDIKYDI